MARYASIDGDTGCWFKLWAQPVVSGQRHVSYDVPLARFGDLPSVDLPANSVVDGEQ